MSAESQLYAALSGYAGLTALVSTRIYPDALPENVTLPAVVFARANSSPQYSIHGALLYDDVEMQIGAWATTRTAADAIAVQVVAALAAAGEQHAGQQSGFDDEVGLYAATVDVVITVST